MEKPAFLTDFTGWAKGRAGRQLGEKMVEEGVR